MKIVAAIILVGMVLAGPVMAREATGSGTWRGEFRQKLQTLKDERKKKIVERADLKLAEINKRRTDAMMRHLDKMSEILAKVKARGGDTTVAEAVVAEARSAVAAQAAKIYTIIITTEDKLRINVGETMRALMTDLRKLHEEKIVAARKAVSDAIKSVKPASTP